MSPDVDPDRAYERLDQILAQPDYQEYVSPVEWIVRAFDWFTGWFSSIPFWAQIVFISVLVLILAAIVAHLVWTMVRVYRGAGPAEPLPEPESVRSVRDLPARRQLLSQAQQALEAGQRAEALRLYYLAVLAALR